MVRQRVFVIAEAGVNHNGSVERALELVRVAAASGADAVKFQTFKAESLVSAAAPMAEYQKTNTGTNRSQIEMLRELELSTTDFEAIQQECERCGIEFMSTPFDEESADALERLGMKTWKIPSGELTNCNLIRHVSAKPGRVILSTGMATLDEVQDAVEWVRESTTEDLCVLHCVSAYPAPFEDLNLRAMKTLADSTSCAVGLSDHSLGTEACIAATALGAVCLEKHFTLDRGLPGPDHKASLEPQELASMIRAVRNIEVALGSGVKVPTEAERNTAEVARRSWTTRHALPAGQTPVLDQLQLLRPGTGIAPKDVALVTTRPLTRAVPAGHTLTEEDFR